MGGRGTYAAGKKVPHTYETVGNFRGIKVLKGKGGLHNLPEESHTSKAYVKLFKDGNLQMLRLYDNDHFLVTEIGFHREPELTGHNKPVYHIHEYTRDFKMRSKRLFTADDLEKYGKYLTKEGHLK